jgi:hypothetical protein
VLKLVSYNGEVLRFVNDSFKDDEGVVLEAIKFSPGSIKHASERLKNDPRLLS